ncbi:hypothetical protein [Nostoc sp.]|uniref:hypothetical protein n=1 Tax=Nostoc sp. TaxID=1180 RepID=UPI002FF6C953
MKKLDGKIAVVTGASKGIGASMVKKFDLRGALSLDGFLGSGADWLARYKPFIEDGKTIVTSPYKTKSMGCKPTTSFCNCVNPTSAKSFYLECWQIFVLKLTYANCLEQEFQVVFVKDATSCFSTSGTR